MDIAPNVVVHPTVNAPSHRCGAGGYSYTFPGRQSSSDLSLGHSRLASWEICAMDDEKDAIPSSLRVFVTVTVSTREEIVFTSPFGGDDDLPMNKTSSQVFAQLSKPDPHYPSSDFYATGKRQSLPFNLPSFSRRRQTITRSSRTAVNPVCLDVILNGSEQPRAKRFRKQTLSETRIQEDKETGSWLVRVMNKIAPTPEERSTMSSLVRH